MRNSADSNRLKAPREAAREGAWESHSLWIDGFTRMARDPAAVIGLCLFAVTVLLALLAPLIAPHDPTAPHFSSLLRPPSWEYLLGTDELGRDVLSRLLFGARSSLSVGVVAVGIGLSVGTALGLLSGYRGGMTDTIVMRFMDSLLAIPGIILALAIVSVVGSGLATVMVAIGVVAMPTYARLSRASALSLREKEFVEAARVAGAPDSYILTREILPNCLSPLLVQASIGFADAVLIEAALSFLGIGVQPPTPSWGAMLNTGRHYVAQTWSYPFLAGAAIFVTVLAFNLVGDGLRDALDPRTSEPSR